MICVIYSSFPTKDSALRIGKLMLEEGLIACVNVFKMDTQYIWKGKFHEEDEYGAYFKTSIYKKNQVIKYINSHHPYEIPLITNEEVVVNNAYKAWMDSFLTNP
ncbi:MAG: divalent-cation tolerance protein CutA [Saprospiraceae bacterium]|nr:divalent-cation tolerance protein CutA [Bacteroidia bacterium]NNE16091.1 divalent-cation tolerance protein CutA [Saprospiraceae bacterium]NNL90651.1 divalent-cation tolerance protein CutA [Saprospiraceae bacterium]